jgi:1-aminocyclopropane-1-carboxylate deaminase/D-cysteine desulfhydrase-like pyridoxal-dependent ACC family enzyme
MASSTSSPALQLERSLAALPRFRVARLPTPLDELPNLSAHLGVRLLVKRDDMTGLAFGGNKTRELDYFIGEALASGADTFISGGGMAQSNHALQCSAAARRAGMFPVEVLHSYRSDDNQGNLLLTRMTGADIRLVQSGSIDQAINQRHVLLEVMESVAEEYRRKGHRPYILPSSFHPLGAAAYAGCALELAGQLDQAGIVPEHVYVTSSGATQVGLALGAKALGAPYAVTGIRHTVAADGLEARLLGLAAATAERLGSSLRLGLDDLPSEGFAGDGYGIPSAGGLHAIHLLATLEGMFLDPVYSSKGMAGLIAHVRSGRIAQGSTIVFVHTGGLPALFAYSDHFETPAMAPERGRMQ